ncbi:hypothetical protein GQ44DRAFT_772657 [Phaeosphaeriaceae sp. PMI808]|nr:hypothetical protein GQ44DRAFT_772657 [Phaeosphaeriaceae sp. PMI808]
MSMPLLVTPNARDLFARDAKAKIPHDLKSALALLRLSGYEELQDRFLSTDAFLRPWSVFREAMLLISPDAITRTTRINDSTRDSIGDDTGVSRLDILWFYTQFEEGKLRYDPRADRWCRDFTEDSSVYGVIDKSKWCITEHEKHFYAWLLQEFKVGKAYNPWRFDYLELKNICSAWEEVFVPIVSAVRASYHPKGRKHYGPLALFVEAKCPSRHAFPDINVYVPHNANSWRAMHYQRQGSGRRVLKKKHYDDAEKGLRDVYPQYGGLVERPKFKHKMEEWLAEQRTRADLRTAHEGKPRPQNVQAPVSPQRRSKRDGNESQIKRYSDTIRHSLTQVVTSMKSKEEQKSPLHGVTRQLHFPDRSLSPELDIDSNHPASEVMPSAFQEQHRKPSGVSGYNPAQRARSNTTELTFSPMGQLSAVPHPLCLSPDSSHNAEQGENVHPDLREKRPSYDIRAPSYEGTGYQGEISLTNLHAGRTTLGPNIKPPSGKKAVTRLPAPIVPIPYCGPRVASADTPSKAIAPLPKPVLSLPKAVALPHVPVSPLKPAPQSDTAATKGKANSITDTSAPKRIAWPGFDSDDEDASPSAAPAEIAPAIPLRSPERRNTAMVPSEIRNPRARKLSVQEDDMQRIVSKENIRAALGRTSAESTVEEQALRKPFAAPAFTSSPMKQKLQAYNKNLFPRKEERMDSTDL